MDGIYAQILFFKNRPEQSSIRVDEGFGIMKEEVTNTLKSA